MDSRRTRLKELVARCGPLWEQTPLPESLAGESRIETRNTLYELRDGVCHSVHRDSVGGSFDPALFLGMRVVGWLPSGERGTTLSLQWQPGAHAVLWRPKTGPGDRSAIALTSPSVAFRQTAPCPSAPPPARPRSVPPPLPLSIRRPALARPPTPPSLARPPPLSRWRVLGGASPPPPETPTPARRSSAPPPLPSQVRAHAAARPGAGTVAGTVSSVLS